MTCRDVTWKGCWKAESGLRDAVTHASPPRFRPFPTVTEGDESVIGYLKYCREQGMNYKAEITDMLQGGLYSYKDKVQAIMQVRPSVISSSAAHPS